MVPPGLSISARRFPGWLPPGTLADHDRHTLGIGAARRTVAVGLALLITGGLLVLLLSFGFSKRSVIREEAVTLVTLETAESSDASPDPAAPETPPAKTTPGRAQPEVVAPPPTPLRSPEAPPLLPQPSETPPAAPASQAILRPSDGRVYGPPNIGGSASRDTEQVGTAPNGEPLYAASWYREPSDSELRGYLSTASGPGWGLIACRTAPDYRVEDCVGLDEYPFGSQINRAVLAAAWQFRVRPPRRNGQLLVGSWVRIRIDYGVGRRSARR
ncbi:protein TonB [Sphingopyxis flava]|uniref:Protein TonB n=2 Tax=Sphingopyxis flava TaxID=1507287 RepID=A0A1T5CZH4_9SPHN|nr:protein TonB [Sphingopyxis flava]